MNQYHMVSMEELAWVRARRAEGWRWQDIAERMGRNMGSLCALIKRPPRPPSEVPRRRQKWTDLERLNLCEMIAAQSDWEVVADDLGRSIQACQQQLKLMGLCSSDRDGLEEAIIGLREACGMDPETAEQRS